MKAVVIKRFGSSDVLEYEYNYLKPEILKNQVLIKVNAAGVNPLDIRTREGQLRLFTGSRFPIILGNDVSGVIEECGGEVRNFKPGDQVYGMVDSYEVDYHWKSVLHTSKNML